ncbi:hypothetical protein MUTS15_15300 [Escherichia coli]|nr:hypothetical protein MUTS15_15300 [Escherichia coli]
MIRQKILQQLLEWIECNLEHPISIEDIAQKSGYSRRNIQLLFRNFMHVPLGEYIRKRRLCRAAILVRLSAKSMLDIALSGNDSNLLIVFYVQIMPDDFVMQLHRF